MPTAAPSLEPLPTPSPAGTPVPVPQTSPSPSPLPSPSPSPSAEPIWAEERVLFSNANNLAAQNQPVSPTQFTLTQTTQLTYLETYHWNNAQGAVGGTLALLDSKGRYYGAWPVRTKPGQGGVPNAYWYVTLTLTLPPETYTVVDSDSATWSHNSANGNQGMTLIKGREPLESVS